MDVDIALFFDIINSIKQIRPTIDKKANHFAIIFKKDELDCDKKLAFSTNFIPTATTTMKSIHAEQGGLEKLAKLNKYRKLKRHEKIDIVVIRMTYHGTLGNSRPCKGCILRMAKINQNIKINNIYYSYAVDTFKKENFRDMYISDMNRFSSGDNRNTTKYKSI